MVRVVQMVVVVVAACGPPNAVDRATETSSGTSSASDDPVYVPWDGLEIAYLADRIELVDVPQWTLRLATPDGRETLGVSQASVISDRVAWSQVGDAIAYVSTSDSEQPYAARVVDSEGDAEVGRFGVYFGGRPTPTTTAIVWSASEQALTATVPAGVAGFQCTPSAGHSLWEIPLGAVAASNVSASDVPASPASWSMATGALTYSTRFPICDDFGVEHPASWGIWQQRPSGGAEYVDIPRIGGNEPDAWHPLWSPDGRRLAVNVGRIDDPRSTRVVVVELDESTLPDVDSPACSLSVAVWFPGGDELLARGDCPDESSQHVIVDVETGVVTHTFADLGATVSIAPDGRRIAYAGDREGEPWVAILDRDTGASTWLVAGEHPQWRPAAP